MKKFIIGGAAVLATAGIGLGLTQLASADSNSPEPTESSSVSAATGQAAAQQGGQPGGLGGSKPALRGLDTAALAQKLGVEESKLAEALQSIAQTQDPGGAPDQAREPGSSSSAQASDGPSGHNDPGQAPAVPPGESGDRDTETATALAQALDLDESTVTAAIQEVRTEANKKVLDQAVSDGKLTQEEADAVAKAAAAGITEIRGTSGGPR